MQNYSYKFINFCLHVVYFPFSVMMFPVVLLLERKLLPDGGKNSYYPGVHIHL